MANLKLYRNVCLVVVVTAFCIKGYGQTVTQVVDATVSSYQGTSYQAYHSVTLAPGFSFSPDATNTSFFVTILGQDHKPDDPNLIQNNAVRTDIIKVGGINNQSQIATGVNAQTQVSYMDGLGRPIQRITQQGSPLQKDIVQFMVYDQYGRQSKQYLPYTSATNDGSLQVNPVTVQQSFYQTAGQQIATDNAPFAVTLYDNSPLERVLESGAPGSDWQPGNHTVKGQFRLNTTADNIMIWTVNGPTNTYYSETQLSVNDVTDENGNHVLSFTNKLGQLVSKKVQANTGYLETIYIYDDASNLAYQVSPEGIERIYAGTATWNSSFTATWASSYTYDAKNRLITKQAPGAGPLYMVYDANNRLILMQDSRIRNAYGSTDKWYATKYDAANRLVISGLYSYVDPGTTGSSNREKLQNYLDGLVYNNTSTFAYESRAAGTTYGYTGQAFPTIADADVQSVNYYDDYDFNNDGTPDYQYTNPGQSGYATTNTTDNSGFLTGSFKRVIGTNNWIKQAVFYDQFGNAIQKQSNSLLNQTGLDISSNAYDIYAGHITQTTHIKGTSTASITIVNKMSYDRMDRTTQIAMNINGGTDQVLAQYEYNELGQLKDKKLHQKTNASFLQTVDYRYNIRGWLTGINNSNLSNADGVNTGNDDVFGMTFLYNQTDATGLNNTLYYNGKVSAIKWKTNDQFSSSANPLRERSYTFTYDNVDRLTSAVYAANSGSGWNVELNAYNEAIGGYDNNGNILSLQRNAQADDNHSAVMIDDLTYHYINNASNQLSYISDASGNANGYNGMAASTTQYGYDTNGNLTGDVNKGETITYNDLNKVSSVVTANGTIQYTYDASGIRIRKAVYNPATSSTTTYDYIEGFIYTNNNLTSFPTAEGRVLAVGSSFTYEYNIKDHLGNVRVSFHDNGSGVAAITQENEYYPFGMTMRGVIERTAQNTTANKQLFNGGTELQDDLGFENSYSTFYREYDPQTGRFNAIDPAVDKYASCTPYNFAFNDPVGMNDPMGDDPYTGMGSLPKGVSNLFGVGDEINRMNVTGAAISGQNSGPDLFYGQAMHDMVLHEAMANYDSHTATSAETAWVMYLMSPASSNPALTDQLVSTQFSMTVASAQQQTSNTNSSLNLTSTADVVSYINLLISVNLPEVSISELRNTTSLSWWGNSQFFLDANQGDLSHDQELAKYGKVVVGVNAAFSEGLLGTGIVIEYGTVSTDKNWHQDYRTIYNNTTSLALSGSLGLYAVTSKQGFKTTFSDFGGPVKGYTGNYGIVSVSYSYSTTYRTFGMGVGPGISLPGRGTGAYIDGYTTFTSAPYYFDESAGHDPDVGHLVVH